MKTTREMKLTKKIEEIKQNFKTWTDEEVTFLDHFPKYASISDVAPLEEWAAYPEVEEGMKENCLHIGQFLDSIEDDFEREIVGSILYIGGIDLNPSFGGYALPSTEEVLKVLPVVQQGIKNRSLKIEIREELHILYTPQIKSRGGVRTETHREAIVTDSFGEPNNRDAYYDRVVQWHFPVFPVAA